MTHPASSIKELYNFISFNSEVTNETEAIQILGQTAPATREAADEPQITLGGEYYLTNFDNENRIGLVTNGLSGAFSKIINGTDDERNFFVLTAAEGSDGISSNPASTPCVGYGNVSLAGYNTTLQVGGYPTTTVDFNALYVASYADSTAEQLPTIDPTTGLRVTGQTFTLPVASGNQAYGRDAIIRPRDVLVSFQNATGLFYNINEACLTSVSIGVDLGRDPQNCLGNRYSKSRLLNFPIDCTLSCEFQAPDLVPGTLDAFLCSTGAYSASITCRRPVCPGSTGTTALRYDLRGLRFQSQSENVGLGNEGTSVTLNFVCNIGGPQDTTNGLFLSGSVNP